MAGIGRRAILATGAAFGAATASGARADAAVRLRAYWWGSRERAERTQRVNEAYTRRFPNVSVAGETLEWGDYWTKLATQVAGRNAPDLIQMDYRYLFEYARRGALLPLDAMVASPLAIGDFGRALDGGRVDGKLYGVSLGQNSTATILNRTALEATGVASPTEATTWEEYGRLGAEVTKKAARPNFWGLADAGQREPLFEVFVRQRGGALYDETGKLGFRQSDAADWFALWHDMRRTGACVPGDVAALDKDSIDTSSLSLGKAAIDFAHSNQLVGYQAISKDRLGLTMDPSGGAGARPGQYLKPSQLWSVSARTRAPEEAARLVGFFVADEEGARIAGVERGIPASPRIRDAIAGGLNALDRMMLDYVGFCADRVGDLPPAPPKGAGEIAFLLKQINQSVSFGRATPADAAKRFVDEANDILARA